MYYFFLSSWYKYWKCCCCCCYVSNLAHSHLHDSRTFIIGYVLRIIWWKLTNQCYFAIDQSHATPEGALRDLNSLSKESQQKWKRPWVQGWESLGVEKGHEFKLQAGNIGYIKSFYSRITLMPLWIPTKIIIIWHVERSLTSSLTACRQSFLDLFGFSPASTNTNRVAWTKGWDRLAIFPF